MGFCPIHGDRAPSDSYVARRPNAGTKENPTIDDFKLTWTHAAYRGWDWALHVAAMLVLWSFSCILGYDM